MAVTITVEDGTVVAGANSLVSLEFADQYHEDRLNAAWTGETDDDKRKAALIRGTDYLERRFGARLTGTKVEGAELCLPRENGYDREGTELASDEVWIGIQQAIAEYALRALSGSLDPDPGYSQSGEFSGPVKRIRKKVDVIEKETEYADRAVSTSPRYPAADTLVARYIASPGGSSYR